MARDIGTRVLFLPLAEQDALLASEVLSRADIVCESCRSLEQLCRKIERGAGAALIAQETLALPGDVDRLKKVMQSQPSWSSLPLIILTSPRDSTRLIFQAFSQLESLGKVSFLERPVRIATLVSTLRMALSGRKRQYEVRDLFVKLQAAVDQRDKFLAMLGHELRNPLAAIRSACDVLNLANLDPDIIKKATKIISNQMQHLSRMVDDLLDVSRVMGGKTLLRKQPIELGEVLRALGITARPNITARGLKLQISPPKQEIWVQADATRLEQVLTNLLDNAAKFTDAGEISVEAKREGSMLEIRIRDTGMGMTPEELSMIFDPFGQADRSLAHEAGGLGIGLTLVRSLLELHDGSIEADSQGLGKGSEFVVRLPVIEPPQAETAAAEKKPQLDRSLKVVVVDDYESFANMLSLMIADMGHEVHVFHDGKSLLENAPDLRPHVILLDIGMPEMDGFEVAKRLRQDPSLEKTVLVAISGYGDSAHVRRFEEAGFNSHLLKPISEDKLAEIVNDPNIEA